MGERKSLSRVVARFELSPDTLPTLNDLEVVKSIADDLLLIYIDAVKRLRSAAYQLVGGRDILK
jgi:hypothetical protein